MIELEDRPTDEHLRQFAGCDVCLSPSRWEGLGLPLYEAIAFGMPSITNDSPPMNEVVIDGVNGICVDSVRWGEAGSGIPAFDPDFEQLDGRNRATRRRRPSASASHAGRSSCATARAAGNGPIEGLAGLLERVG